MGRKLVQRVIAIVCLMAFGLGQTVLASAAVRCTDAWGTTRLELACIKNSLGSCGTTCSEPGEAEAMDGGRPTVPSETAPCEDEPIGAQATTARPSSTSVSLEPVVDKVVIAFVWGGLPDNLDQQSPLAYRPCERGHPPDSFVRLRSVILLV